ncbi:hypothetical protein B296_00012992 [Ensete ventricosum]|uniref:Uncharacterized protein n=1 Tax=Ensete ventricosum TaxID=4639 RepID=A0A426ZH75_ENSVE|nr:hypothetical protein B296_00012992 [Ensete ventricosum]
MSFANDRPRSCVGNEPWSREHHCKKGWLLVIEPVEDEDNETSEEALELKEEAMEEESQLADYVVHALAGYSNPQMMKVGGLLKHQPITVLIDTGNTNNFLNSKVATHLVLQIEGDNPGRGATLCGLARGSHPWRTSCGRCLRPQVPPLQATVMPAGNRHFGRPPLSLLRLLQKHSKNE